MKKIKENSSKSKPQGCSGSKNRSNETKNCR